MNDQSTDSQVRRMWVEKIVKATLISQGKSSHPTVVEDQVVIMLPRFEHVETIDLEACFDLGQKCMAANVDEFLEVWQVELESRQREAEIAARQKQIQEEQLRLASPHPVRDAVFAKWGFA